MNKHGLDAPYFKKNLEKIILEIDNYTPEEMRLALTRLSSVAVSGVRVVDRGWTTSGLGRQTIPKSAYLEMDEALKRSHAPRVTITRSDNNQFWSISHAENLDWDLSIDITIEFKTKDAATRFCNSKGYITNDS